VTVDAGYDLAYLLDLERIKRLKARYFRFLDEQNWAGWSDLFTEDARFDLHRHGQDERWAGRVVLSGRTEIVAYVSKRLQGVISVHHGHTPDIELDGPDRAHGSWAMSDYLEEPVVDGSRVRLLGHGYYFEDYRKEGDFWRIANLRLTRIRIDRFDDQIAIRRES
jgi:hypothetical protein